MFQLGVFCHVRFVQNFSGQRISFVKIQKQIKCSVMISNSFKLASEQSEDEIDCALIMIQTRMLICSLPRRKVSLVNMMIQKRGTYLLRRRVSSTSESETSPSFSKNGRKLKVNNINVASKRCKDKIPKLNTLGSANG